MDHTSQLSRIAQSPAATDLSGGKASEALSTVRRINLAAEAAVDIQFDSTLDVAASPWPPSGVDEGPASSVRGSGWNGLVHIPSDSPSRDEIGGAFPTSD